MPRLEINNPTQRIQRLLVEMEDMKLFLEEVQTVILKNAPGIFELLPATPALVHYEKELTRQGLTSATNRKQLEHKRRVRASAPEGTYPSSMKQAEALHAFQPIKFDEEEEERIAAIIRKEMK